MLLVEDIRIEDSDTTTVYNFQVEDFHTYYVSELGVLVHNAQYPKTRTFEPNDGKHKGRQNGKASPDPYYGNESAGQEALNKAYNSPNTKQLYNIENGKLVKFQPDGQGGFHAYEVQNPAIEVPTDVHRQMKVDGLITNSQYKGFIKNN